MQSQAELFKVVFALGASGGFTGLLYGRQQQRDEDGDNGYDHQQFDQGEGLRVGLSGLQCCGWNVHWRCLWGLPPEQVPSE